MLRYPSFIIDVPSGEGMWWAESEGTRINPLVGLIFHDQLLLMI